MVGRGVRGEGAFCSTGLSRLFNRLLDSRSCQTARQISIAVCESRGGRLGSPSLIVRTVSVDVMQQISGAVCDREGGRRWLPVPNTPYGLCGRNAVLKKNTVASDLRAVCEREGGRRWLPVPNTPSSLRT